MFLALLSQTDKNMSAKNVNNINKRKATMLKAYAVAVVLATTAPAVIKSVEGVQTPVKTETTTSETDTAKNGVRTGSVRFHGVRTGSVRF
jgi:hypothetical protein